jgi:hypothetical protein
VSVQEVTYYQAVCEGCGAVDSDGDFSAWADADSAVEAAIEGSDWYVADDDKLYCTECGPPSEAH